MGSLATAMTAVECRRPASRRACRRHHLTEIKLAIDAGRVLTRDHILQQVWGSEYSGDSEVLRTTVKILRRRLGDDANGPKYIFTDPRVGYRMAKL